MFCSVARLGRRHAGSPRSGPSRTRIPSWMWLSARKHSTKIHRAQPIEQAEDQADHSLDLLIGIQGHLARGAAHETGRRRHGQSPRRALASRPDHIRCLIRCSSASLIVPFNPIGAKVP
jgi:hypothetical protein